MIKELVKKSLSSYIIPSKHGYVSHNHDTILITGGSNGLGLEIAKNFLNKEFKVIILDVQKPPKDLYLKNQKMIFIEIDLANISSLSAQIEKSFQLHNIQDNSIKVIINNAGITCGKTFEDLDKSMIEKTILVNYESVVVLLLSLRRFMNQDPSCLVMNIASVLGLITPANLTIYGCTKRALIELHNFIIASNEIPNSVEYQNSKMDSILVLPGQINTDMFKGVRTPNSLIAPVLEKECLAKDLVDHILNYNTSLNGTIWRNNLYNRKQNVFYAPFYVGLVPTFNSTPWLFQRLARKFSGMDQAMHNYSK